MSAIHPLRAFSSSALPMSAQREERTLVLILTSDIEQGDQ